MQQTEQSGPDLDGRVDVAQDLRYALLVPDIQRTKGHQAPLVNDLQAIDEQWQRAGSQAATASVQANTPGPTCAISSLSRWNLGGIESSNSHFCGTQEHPTVTRTCARAMLSEEPNKFSEPLLNPTETMSSEGVMASD